MALSVRNIHLLQVLLLLGLILLTIIILWPFQRALDASMEDFKLQLISYLEGRIGRRIEYESISPALFRYLEIRELAIFQETSPEESLVRIKKVRVSYNILKLFSPSPLEAVDEIRFENSRFLIDTERDAPLLKLLQELRPTPRSVAISPPIADDIRFSGRNLSVEVLDSGRRYLAEDIFFDFERENERYEGSIRSRLAFDGLESDPLGLGEGRLRASGSSALDFQQIEVTLELDDLVTDVAAIPQVALYFELNPETVQLRKIQDREPFDLSMVHQRNGGITSLNLVSEEFVPSTVMSLNGRFAAYEDWLDSALSGSGTIEVNRETESFGYTGDLRLTLSPQILGMEVASTARFEGDTSRISFDSLFVDAEIGRASYRGDLQFESLLPNGALSLRDIALPTGDFLNLDLSLNRRGDRVGFDANSRIDGILFPGMTGTVRYVDRRWEYAASMPIQNRGAELGVINLDGIYTRDEGYLQTSAMIESLRLDTVQTLLTGRDASEWLMDEGLLAGGSLFFYRDVENFSFLAPDLRINAAEDPSKEIAIELSGSDSGFGIELSDLRYGIYRASGGIELKRDGGGYDFSVDAEVQDIPYAFRGRFENSQVVAEGTYIETFFADLSGPTSLVLVSEDFPLPFPRVLTRLDLNLRGYGGEGGLWTLWSENSRIRNIPGQAGENSLELTFRLDNSRLDLYTLRYADQLSIVEGNGFFRLERLPEGAGIPFGAEGWMQLDGENSDESYQLIVSLREDEVESDFQFREAPLSRFGNLPVSGLSSGDLTVEGLPRDPDIFLRLELAEGELNQDPFELSTVLTLEDKNLAIKEFSVGYLGAEIREGSGIYRLEQGELTFDAGFRLPMGSEITEGDLNLAGRTISLANREELAQVLENPFDGVVQVDNIRRGNEMEEGWNLDFGFDGSLFAFYGGPEGAVSGTVNDTREFSLAVTEPLPAQFRLGGRIVGGEIDASLESLSVDLNAVQSIFNFPFFAIQSGSLFGTDLVVRGPVNDPDFFGTLNLRDLKASSAVIPEEIGPFSTLLRLEEKQLSIEDAYLPVGLGSVSADLNFIMEHWVPSTYDIRLDIDPEQGIRVKMDISKLQIDGYARGLFTIRGDNLGTELGGDLRLSSAVLTLTNREPQEPEGGNRGFRTDLTLTTGKSVEFLWPSLNLPIIRSFARTDQEIRIESDSSADTFSVEGAVEIQGGIILYFQRNFYIKEGSIRFRENEIQFDPILSARAELREVNAEGEDVQIFLIVDERPLSQFAPRFESIPSYSDVEIAALLGTSIFGSPVGDTINPSDALIQTSDLLIGQLGVVRSFEQSMKEILNLDLFSVRTQIFQNILLDRMIVEEQADEFTSTNSTAIGRYLDNTTLFLGKYFGDDVFLEAMLQVESNEQFFADFGGEQVYELDTEVSVEWQTPFFLFDFSVSPDFRDIVSSVTTARVGLSWALSF